jgi:hypothetical protein
MAKIPQNIFEMPKLALEVEVVQEGATTGVEELS